MVRVSDNVRVLFMRYLSYLLISCSADLHANAALRLVCRFGSFDGSHLNIAEYFSSFHLSSSKP